MALYKSNLVTKKGRHRGLYEGTPKIVSGRLFLASGTALTTSDDLLMVPIGENLAIKEIRLLVLGDTSTIAGSIGTFQILDRNDDPVVVQRLGPLGPASSMFTSPATSAASLRAAGQLDGYTETVIATPAKLAGPTNVGIRITTGGTIAADTEIFLEVEFEGETGTNEVVAEYPNSYPYSIT